MKQATKLLAMMVAVLILMGACTQKQPRSERVSDEELAALREQYPYNDSTPPTASVTYQHLQTWEELLSRIRVSAVAVVELEGDWFTGTAASTTFRNASTEQIPSAISSFTGVFHAAVVKNVIWSNCEIEAEDELVLFFGSTLIAPLQNLTPTYQTEAQYLCFLYNYQENSYQIPAYTVEKETTWHLTDSGILVAASSHIGCIDACSGMYLYAFEQNLSTYLGEPDAELTPVVPEQERE